MYKNGILMGTAKMQNCNMYTYFGNGTQERAVQDFLCLV